LKLLYDIYHMQIMEGDLIRTINKKYRVAGAFFTREASRGRHELDNTQEVNWVGVDAGAIAGAKYTGYVAHEFYSPRGSR